jgi:hypothetical protein
VIAISCGFDSRPGYLKSLVNKKLTGVSLKIKKVPPKDLELDIPEEVKRRKDRLSKIQKAKREQSGHGVKTENPSAFYL